MKKDTPIAQIIAAVGLIGVIVTFIQSPDRAWMNLLTNGYFYLGISVFGFAAMAVFGAAQSSWWVPMKRVFQGMAANVPLFGVLLFLTVALGIHSLYEWTHMDVVMKDPVLSKKTAWLNIPGFLIRTAIYLGLWIYISRKLQSEPANRIKTYAIACVIFALSWSFASWDWIMSLEPHWFSTMYGVYTFASMFCAGFAVLTLLVLNMKERGFLPSVNENHYHDLGKLLKAFSAFWAYIWFCQYMLIWYSNIPEETMYFYIRQKHGWEFLFYGSFIACFVIPFFFLLPRGMKRNPVTLKIGAWIVVVAHVWDYYMMVSPSYFHHRDIHGPMFGWQEVSFILCFAGLAAYTFKAQVLKRIASEPKEDPYFEEGAHLAQ